MIGVYNGFGAILCSPGLEDCEQSVCLEISAQFSSTRLGTKHRARRTEVRAEGTDESREDRGYRPLPTHSHDHLYHPLTSPRDLIPLHPAPILIAYGRHRLVQLRIAITDVEALDFFEEAGRGDARHEIANLIGQEAIVDPELFFRVI